MNRLGEDFEVRGVLGRGSFGDVYLAKDCERGGLVAVKLLRAPEERQVQRFKREFRALSRLHHPNLVMLYELRVANGEWLLIMEPIDGEPPSDVATWRAALPGIARGLNALHAVGYLHRDLKAENVVVTAEGRAVLLDFGALGRSGKAGPVIGNLMGIAPEQAAGREAGPASDWYALGAILYQALTGTAPFEGRGAQVLARKMRKNPPLVKTAPEHEALAELTNALLLRDPVERLVEAKRLLPLFGAPVPLANPSDVFVGRRDELRALDEALARAREGRVEHVRVRGEPGMGKSALLEAWSRMHPQAVWLRCFEQDGSAYAGLDLVVEALYAERVDREVEMLDDDHRAALATLFPSAGWTPPMRPMEPVRTRALTAEALRRMLRSRAAESCPVLIVDDVQWGGEDSGQLIRQLVEAPWLIVTAARADAGDLTRALDQAFPITTTLELSPLDAGDIDPDATAVDPVRLARAMSQAQGHPLFLHELLHAESASTELLPLLRERVRALPPSAASLMQVLVAAARPVDRELALSAHGSLLDGRVRERPFHDVMVLLRERMARLSYTRSGSRLEPTHELIREASTAELSVGSAVHAALDDAMRTLSVDEPDHQARHARAAGRRVRAAHLYERAAERAASSLAFTRAAELYALGRACADHEAVQQRLDIARARALGSSGMHLLAAEAFAQAAEGRALVATDPEVVSLHRQRAEHLLHAGAMKEGERALELCLNAAGIDSRRTRRGLLASILLHQTWLHTRGKKPPPRSNNLSRLELGRVDLCFSAALALTNVDTLRGMDFALRSARRAHRGGDPRRFARSYALITAYCGSSGEKARARVSPMIERVRRFGDEFDDAHLRGMADAAECLLLFHCGEHAKSLALAERAERTFRTEAGAPREATTALIYRCANLASLGRFEALATTRRELLDDSVARHDDFGKTHSRIGLMNLVWLLEDDPDRATRELSLGTRQSPEGFFQFAHFFALMAAGRIDLYRGEPGACLERLGAAASPLHSSLILRVPYVRAQISDLAARAWLQLAGKHAAKGTWLRAVCEARREARRIRGLRAAVHLPLAEVIEAGVLLLLGREARALSRLRTALAHFRALGLRGHAFAVAHRLEAYGAPPQAILPPLERPKDAARFARALAL